MLRGVAPGVVVGYVLFMCAVVSLGWLSLAGYMTVRAFKAFAQVRRTLNEIASDEEKERLAWGQDDIYVIGSSDVSVLELESSSKVAPTTVVVIENGD